MLDDKLKKELLQLTDMMEIGKFLKENKIDDLLVDDNEIHEHLHKYYNFPEDGIIRDIR